MLSIRSANEMDIDHVLRIERASFADPWTVDAFASSLEPVRMLFLIAEENTPCASAPLLLGYVIAVVMGEEAEVADLAVTPDSRRRGVGGLLLDRVSADLQVRGVASLYLEVRESNLAARKLYTSRFFLPVGRRRGYYQHPPEDALIMRRDIAPT